MRFKRCAAVVFLVFFMLPLLTREIRQYNSLWVIDEQNRTTDGKFWLTSTKLIINAAVYAVRKEAVVQKYTLSTESLLFSQEW